MGDSRLTYLEENGSPFLQDRRELYETYTRSDKCKAECIDEGKIFCSTSEFKSGRCFEEGEPLIRDGFCSSDNYGSPKMFQLLVCPNEDACGSKFLNPSYSGSVLVREIEKYSHKFVKDDVCSFIIKAPVQMTEYDKLWLKIYSIENAEVYVAKMRQANSLTWLNHLDAYVSDYGLFETRARWEFYVVGVATNIFQGSFKIKTWVEHVSPPSTSNSGGSGGSTGGGSSGGSGGTGGSSASSGSSDSTSSSGGSSETNSGSSDSSSDTSKTELGTEKNNDGQGNLDTSKVKDHE